MRNSLFSVKVFLLSLMMLLPLSSQADEQLWEMLKTRPNMIVLMRHTQARGGNALKWDESGKCRGESHLTPDGIEQAKKIGAAFAAHGIKPTVISSPMCRCLETTKYAFNVTAVTDPNLRETSSADPAAIDTFIDTAHVLIASHHGVVPLVFVSHRPNIDQISMELIEIGVLLVGQVNESGDIEIIGRIVF